MELSATQYKDGSAEVNGVEIPDGGPPADQLAIRADAFAPSVRALSHLGDDHR